MLRKKRAVEAATERKRRLEENTNKERSAVDANEDAIDAMVRRSIKLHGA